MILAVDCGNTHITFGCIGNDGNAAAVYRIPTDRAETEYGYAAKMGQILALGGITPDAIRGAALSCVVPPLAPVLRGAVRVLTGLDTVTVGAGIRTGLHIRVNDPGTVAPDLVAAAVAVRETYPLPAVIVDLGTATTLTVVDEKGAFIGGAILPGAGISAHALAESAALLPQVEIGKPRNVIASDTADCMRSGILYGSAGAIDGLIDRFTAEIGQEPASVIATGGLASLICPYCRHTITVDEQLLLRGLAIIWKRNRNHDGGEGTAR